MGRDDCPKWAKKEQDILVLKWFLLADKRKIDLLEYVKTHASDRLMKYLEDGWKEEEENWKKGIIMD